MTTIALIEDNEDLRNYTALFLEQNGYTVVQCEDAESYLETNTTVGLFIIDLNLPEMDGYSLVKSIRASDPGAAIIILSARDWDGDIVKGYELGADIYLTKPTNPAVLLSTVRRLTQRHAGLNAEHIGLSVNRVTQVMHFDQASCPISGSELAILYRLSIAGARGLERFEMAEVLNLDLDQGSRKAIDVRIVRLRKKLASLGCAKSTLETMRGYGYRLNLPMQITS